MSLGIDIYRYQTVTDWQAVKRHGVSFVYVKATDGGGPAIVRADSQVRGAQKVGIPVGLYHYAQLSPSPEDQAKVLAGEVRRLAATGMPPALDLEDPWTGGTASRAFAQRFLAQLRREGFRRVCLYANTSMLTSIGAPQLAADDFNLWIWAASYGANDDRYDQADITRISNYRGRVSIFQYSSTGLVPGISGQVDLNQSLTEVLGDNDMTDINLAQIIRFWDGFEITLGQAIADTWQLANNVADRPTRPDQPADPPPWLSQLPQLLAEIATIKADVGTIKAGVAALSDDEANLLAAIRSGGVDPATFAALVGPLIKPGMTREEMQAAAIEGVRLAFARAGQEDGRPLATLE